MIRSINAFRALALCAGLIPAAALAQDKNGHPAGEAAPQKATTLAAGGISGGNTLVVAACTLYNAGDSAVSFSKAEIVSRTGPEKLIFNNCNVALAAGKMCQFNTGGSQFEVHGCKVVFSPDSKLVRGDFEIVNLLQANVWS